MAVTAATTATAATVMQVAAITAAVAATAATAIQGYNNYQQGKFAQAEAEINQAQMAQSQKQAFQEESLNRTQQYRAGRHDLAAGANLLSGMGFVGTSAETAYREGAFNLSEDLSALKYKYDAEAAKYGTQMNMYGQHAKMAKYNRRMGVLASSINTVGTAAKGMYSVGRMYGWGFSPNTINPNDIAIDPNQVASASNSIGAPELNRSLSDNMPWRLKP